jgi:hypothetical protein
LTKIYVPANIATREKGPVIICFPANFMSKSYRNVQRSELVRQIAPIGTLQGGISNSYKEQDRELREESDQ